MLATLPPEVVLESCAVLARKIAERAGAYERELRLPRPDGGVRWLTLRVHLVWQGERVVRLRGACIDVTERRAVDELLGRTRAELSEQVADLHRLHELSSRLLETTLLPEQLRMILAALAHFHGARRGLVALFDADSGTLGIDASTGFAQASLARLLQTSGVDGASALACASRERAVVVDTEVPDTDAGLRALAREEGFRAVHSTPLIGQRGDVRGRRSRDFDEPRQSVPSQVPSAPAPTAKAATFAPSAPQPKSCHPRQTNGSYTAPPPCLPLLTGWFGHWPL